MKKLTTLIIITLFPICIHAQKFSAGASAGLISVDSNTGINGNIYLAYNINDKISVGVDGLLGEGEEDLKTTAFLAYVEAGNPSWGLDKKNVFYFTGILGLGYVETKIPNFEEDAFSFFAGTKLNINVNPKFIFGIKSGIYLSELDNDPIIANIFFTYKL
jgi:hypothetical protein